MISQIKSKLNSDKNLKEIVLGSVITFILKIGGMFIGYLLVLLISKQYGASGIGLYSLSLSIITFFAIFSALGMNMSILRYVGQFNKEKNNQKLKLLYIYAIKIALPVSIFLSIILFFIAEYIALDIFHDINYIYALKIGAFIIPFFTIVNLNIEYIRGLKNLKVSEFLRSVNRPIINLLLLLVIGLYIQNEYLPLYTLAMATISTFLVSMYFIITKIQHIEILSEENFTKKELMTTSLPMLITALSSFILGNISLFFLQSFSTSADVGIFSVSLKIALLISLVLMVVNTISAPKFSELYWAKEYKALQNIISQSTKIIFFISLIMVIIVGIFNEQILGIFGTEFIDGKTALLLLIVGQLINAATGSVGVFLNMTGHQNIMKNIMIATMLISIILNYLLIPIYGINGAAFVSMLSSVIANLVSVYYVKTKLGYTTYFVPNFLRKNYER